MKKIIKASILALLVATLLVQQKAQAFSYNEFVRNHTVVAPLLVGTVVVGGAVVGIMGLTFLAVREAFRDATNHCNSKDAAMGVLTLFALPIIILAAKGR